jgi:hypothetical protein
LKYICISIEGFWLKGIEGGQQAASRDIQDALGKANSKVGAFIRASSDSIVLKGLCVSGAAEAAAEAPSGVWLVWCLAW